MVAAAAAATRQQVKFLKLAALPILQQLQLEEALLRATSQNWFLINEGTPAPSIVMGVSGCVGAGDLPDRLLFLLQTRPDTTHARNWDCRKVEELIRVDQARNRQLGVIKRFTGGGTVVVDADTIFTTLIMQVGTRWYCAAGWWPHNPAIARLMSSRVDVCVCCPRRVRYLAWSASRSPSCAGLSSSSWRSFRSMGASDCGSMVSMHVSAAAGSRLAVSAGLRLGAKTLCPAVLTATRRLCLWGAQVWRQCAGHHQQALAAPHLTAVGLRSSQHGCADQPQEAASIQTGR